MKTYLFKDGTHYKIGRSENVMERFNTIKRHNPTLEVVTFIDKNIEARLHQKYKKNRDVYEWFLFSDTEIRKIIEEDYGNPNLFEIPFLDYKIKEGEYEGRFLITMFSNDEINYIRKTNNKYFDFWLENHLRYSFMKKELEDYNKVELKVETPVKHEDIARLISIIDDLYLNRDLFLKYNKIIGTKKLLKCLEEIGGVLNLQTIPDYAKVKNLSYNGVKKHRHVQEIFKVKFVIDND